MAKKTNKTAHLLNTLTSGTTEAEEAKESQGASPENKVIVVNETSENEKLSNEIKNRLEAQLEEGWPGRLPQGKRRSLLLRWTGRFPQSRQKKRRQPLSLPHPHRPGIRRHLPHRLRPPHPRLPSHRRLPPSLRRKKSRRSVPII